MSDAVSEFTYHGLALSRRAVAWQRVDFEASLDEVGDGLNVFAGQGWCKDIRGVDEHFPFREDVGELGAEEVDDVLFSCGDDGIAVFAQF